MLKKSGVVALGVVAALFVLSCTQLGSYFCTWVKQVRVSAEKQVPIEVVIQNLRDEVVRLDPDIKRNQTIVAEEIVAVEKLRAEVENGRKKLTLQKEQMSAVVAQLKKDDVSSVSYDGRQVSPARARERLSQDLDIAQRFEKALESKKRQLDARERLVEVSRKKLQALVDAKVDLQAQIAQLEADYQEVQLQATQSRVQFDDSRLANIKQQLESLRDRVRVEKVTQDLADSTPLPEDKAKVNSEVVRNAERFLNGEKDDDKVTADRK